MRDRSAIGTHSRRKGRAFEQWVARQIREAGIPARRGYQSRGGHEEPDVSTEDWVIECKAGGPAKDPLAALEQAEGDAAKSKDGRTPVAICKRDRCEPTATMRLGRITAQWNENNSAVIAGCGRIPITMSFANWLLLARRF